jgi:ppGpp synthetase/RelA/SpoT-type nucleotidyltranferase
LINIDHPEFFELQIKTLFQHAWSEADHDLAYKSVRALDELEQRQIAFSAAQAWGADRIFEELATQLVPGMTEV